ncbi:Brefeldin A-Inhibited Guanine Nucleotide-Exchange Protein 1 [Manis pentadactyla]|nr:Brefeldin A-Inhibited Guanine Nucleotide-Exchange Protein 1 [Manis pentadactyla]
MQERSGTLWPLPECWAWRVVFLAFDKRTVPGLVLELHGWARPECSQGLSYREDQVYQMEHQILSDDQPLQGLRIIAV